VKGFLIGINQCIAMLLNRRIKVFARGSRCIEGANLVTYSFVAMKGRCVSIRLKKSRKGVFRVFRPVFNEMGDIVDGVRRVALEMHETRPEGHKERVGGSLEQLAVGGELVLDGIYNFAEETGHLIPKARVGE